MAFPFVSEDIIEQVAVRMSDSEEEYTQVIEELEAHQPVLLSYLLSENFKLLTQDEQAYLLYLALVIWQSSQIVQRTSFHIETDLIESKEEANWVLLHASKARRFKERLDGFFDNTTQEDLLAFIEDALMEEEEDNFVTKEGKELLFVGLKTVVDCLCD